MLLALVMLFQQIPFAEIKAKADDTDFPIPKFRVLFYTDKFKSKKTTFNNVSGISNDENLLDHIQDTVLDAVSDAKQRRKWEKLIVIDQLSPGEIHRRVQDDIWSKNEEDGIVNVGELPIQYDKTITPPTIPIGIDKEKEDVKVSKPSKSSGRADIYAKKDNDNISLWEVKPPSYWTKNYKDGVLQLARYVYYGVDDDGAHPYKFGEKATPNIIADGKSSFNAYYICTNLVTEWSETVTYEYEYRVTEDSLIIYNFERADVVRSKSAPNPALAKLFDDEVAKLRDKLKNKNEGFGNKQLQNGYSYNWNLSLNQKEEYNTNQGSNNHYVEFF